MPQKKRPAAQRLSDSINVPLMPGQKRRVVHYAKREPGKPAPTSFVRILIDEGIARRDLAAAK